MGTRDGVIIATIITTHIPRNEAAAPGQDCPGILIQAMDMVQPPGMGMPPPIDLHQRIVPPALARKRSAQAPRNARSRVTSGRPGAPPQSS
jgi:hypothetical protein